MATNNLIYQLTNTTPENGENIIRRTWIAPIGLQVSGATRAAASNSLPVDVIVLDAANESVVINFPIPIDMDLDPGSLVLRAGVMVGLVSGSSTPSLDVDLDTITAIRAGATTLNGGVAAITPPSTTATELSTIGDIQTIEYDLSATIAALADPLAVGDALAIEIDAAAVDGTSPVAHLYGAYVEYGSMVVAALVANRS
ncbi:MAG: hypothetical protein ACOC4K_02895 [Verrucomicrobiota bacterium]